MAGGEDSSLAELLQLFQAKSKKDARRIARRIRLTKPALGTVIKEAVAFGFNHRIKHCDYVPTERAAKLETFWEDAADPERLAKATRNLSSLFRERKYVIVHLFEPIAFEARHEWHLFYFSQHDLGTFGGHWKGGEHIHYTSYLYATGATAGQTLQKFDERSHESIPNEHIHTVKFYIPGRVVQSG